jgi:hypothetical protein
MSFLNPTLDLLSNSSSVESTDSAPCEDTYVYDIINEEESDEVVSAPGLAAKIDACTTGVELLAILLDLPKTTGKGGWGLSFNRVLKVC